jgi:ribonuclease BN (tRNA processing enzyme)
MKLMFLGSGSAFTVGNDNFQSNLLLSDGTKRLLIDCGSDARLALHRVNLDHRHIDNVYISHLHADHAGGLEWLGFTRKFATLPKPKLYLHRSMLDDIWEHLLSAGMASIQDVRCDLNTYFKPQPVSRYFKWQGIRFECIQSIHVYHDEQLQPCYGLFFSIQGTRIFFTADTRFSPERLMPYYQQADYIFHDCETLVPPSGVHAHYQELCQLPLPIKQKMWLYHFNPGVLPVTGAEHFRGFVQPRQVFDFSDTQSFRSVMMA